LLKLQHNIKAKQSNFKFKSKIGGVKVDEIKAELEAIKASAEIILKRVESLLKKLDKNTEIDWWDRRNSVLAEVIKRGNVISSEEWIEIGKKYGFDPRGLGGFFTGKRPSMVSIGGGKKAITESGVKDVKEWLRENPEKAQEFGLDPEIL